MKNNYASFLLPIGLFLFISFFGISNASQKNGFDLSNVSIPIAEIFQGGPPKDGIPSIDSPKFLSVNDAAFMNDDDRVLGVEIDGIAKAYPIKILDWHEIVNDVINDNYFVVSYCPLCGTGAVFSSTIKGENDLFGVSGLLYESDVLLYDRKTESLWSQLLGKSVSGSLEGTKLVAIPANHTSWKHWKDEHVETLVLSTDTGFARDYQRTPYDGYDESPSLYFNVSHKAPKTYHPKEKVLGVEVDGQFKAYPFKELSQSKQTSITDEFAGKTLTIHWNPDASSASVSLNGKAYVGITSFWFAWYTFHPEADVYQTK